ncbi:MAG: hypothetical protein S4CHLAM2_16420 [Chlamydiales bacterium]|nr:hypothetical protein [Chlamydiales bacterium]
MTSPASGSARSDGVTVVNTTVSTAARPSKIRRNSAIAVAVILAVGLAIAASLLLGMHFSGLSINQAGFTTVYNKIVTVLNTTQSMSPLLILGKIVVPVLGGTLLIGLVGKAIARKVASKRTHEEEANARFRGTPPAQSHGLLARADDGDSGSGSAPASRPSSRYASPPPSPGASQSASARCDDDGDDDDDDGGIEVLPKPNRTTMTNQNRQRPTFMQRARRFLGKK